MISVNQGAGSSFPEKVEKGKTQDVSYQGGTFELGVGLETLRGVYNMGIPQGAYRNIYEISSSREDRLLWKYTYRIMSFYFCIGFDNLCTLSFIEFWE